MSTLLFRSVNQSSQIADISEFCVIQISLDNVPYKTSLAEQVLQDRLASSGGKEAVATASIYAVTETAAAKF